MKSTASVYIGACYLVSYFLGAAASFCGGFDHPLGYRLLLFNAWVPAIVAVIVRLLTRRGARDVGWGMKRPSSLLAALLPIVVFAAAAAIVACVWPVRIAAAAQGTNTAVALGINTLLNSAFVFGEEFGWRGYLQKEVVGSLGVARGLLALCFVWSFWHLPLDLMGLGYPSMNVALSSFVLRPMAMLGMGMLVGWVYLRTDSIWAACLVHGVNNTVGGQIGRLVDMSPGQWSWALVAVSVLYCGLGLAIYGMLRHAERRQVLALG